MRWRRNGIGIKGLEGGEAGSNVIRDGLGERFWFSGNLYFGLIGEASQECTGQFSLTPLKVCVIHT